jgi:four helix bundle protein
MHNFRELKIWNSGMNLVKHTYQITSAFPMEEKFGLSSQMNRSAVSIPSNIAEGSSRSSNKDFNRFLEIAIGSSFELETQLLLAKELGFVSNQKFAKTITQLNELQKMIVGFKKSISLKSVI